MTKSYSREKGPGPFFGADFPHTFTRLFAETFHLFLCCHEIVFARRFCRFEQQSVQSGLEVQLHILLNVEHAVRMSGSWEQSFHRLLIPFSRWVRYNSAKSQFRQVTIPPRLVPILYLCFGSRWFSIFCLPGIPLTSRTSFCSASFIFTSLKHKLLLVQKSTRKTPINIQNKGRK